MGVPMIVDRIPENDSELVRYLHDSGVLPGVEVVVVEMAPYRGVVTLQIGDESAVLGYNVSGEIRLRER
jgi:Fe2+ transport system protein FeoA